MARLEKVSSVTVDVIVQWVADVVENLGLKFQFQSRFFNPPISRNDQKTSTQDKRFIVTQ